MKTKTDPEFMAHVKLVQKQDHKDEASARFIAWQEGPKGYAVRQEKEQGAEA